MTDNAMLVKDTGQGQTAPRALIIEMLNKKFERLPDIDRYVLYTMPQLTLTVS